LQDVIQFVEADAGDEEPLTRLSAAATMVRDLADVGDAALGYFVDRARRAGHSWSEIGDALGVSKQAAQQKHTARLSLGINTPTLEHFTPRARNVLAAAEPIARHWGHAHVGTEHLLLALYREPEGIAARVLVDKGLPQDRAERAVAARIEPGAGETAEGRLSFSPAAKAAMSGALAAALELGHNYIGTEHLLLGLARGRGLASEILAAADLPQEELVGKVRDELSAYVHRASRPPGARPGRRAAQAPAKRRTASKADAQRGSAATAAGTAAAQQRSAAKKR
jgi:hypothetical protein